MAMLADNEAGVSAQTVNAILTIRMKVSQLTKQPGGKDEKNNREVD